MWEQRRRGEYVAIWTIFAASPKGSLSLFAKTTHEMWGFAPDDDVLRARRLEDNHAARRLGVRVRRFSFLDCIYRLASDGEPLYPQSVFVSPHPLDEALPRQIAKRLAHFLLPQDVLVCPLALGDHVDHVITRRAVALLSRPCWYYADLPYVVNEPRLLSAAVGGLESECFPISEQGLRAWRRGVMAYTSQLDSLLKIEGTLLQALRSYWVKERGIRLWREAAYNRG